MDIISYVPAALRWLNTAGKLHQMILSSFSARVKGVDLKYFMIPILQGSSLLAHLNKLVPSDLVIVYLQGATCNYQLCAQIEGGSISPLPSDKLQHLAKCVLRT